MTAPSSDRTGPHCERRDQLSHVRHFVPLSAASMRKCSSLARQSQAACTAHLGLPLAPAFTTSEERGKCFCAGSRYSLCVAWWLRWDGRRQAQSPRRLLRHYLRNNPKINSRQAYTEGQERLVKVGPAAERARGRAVVLEWAVQGAVIQETAGRVTAAGEGEPTTADQPGPQGDNQRTWRTQQNSSAPPSTNRVSRGSKQR
jgi:hypothetical protein